MNQEEQGKKISELIAKCWADEGFKQKVLADPAATLKAEGLELPAGLSYVAHENTDKVFHLVIPAKPSRELRDDELSKQQQSKTLVLDWWLPKTGKMGAIELSEAELERVSGGTLPSGHQNWIEL